MPSPPPARKSRPPTGNIYADRLLNKSDTVLLYNSPQHTSFRLISYLSAAVFFLGGINTALETKPPKKPSSPDTPTRPPMPWYIRYSFLVGAFGFAIMGTAFVLGPTKLIRRVWLVRQPATPSTPNSSYALKLDIKSSVPLLQGRQITTPLENVSVDRQIRAQDVSWNTVPLTSSAAFTAHYLPDPSSPAPKRPLASRLRGVNASLLNAWPTLVRDVRRMFLRNGIAYVHIVGEGGQWKLDLQDAEVLESGQPIEKLMGTDVQMAKGVVPFLRRLSGAGERGM